MKILPIEVQDGESIEFAVENYQDAPDAGLPGDAVYILNVDRDTGEMRGSAVIVSKGDDALKADMDAATEAEPFVVKLTRDDRLLFASRV